MRTIIFQTPSSESAVEKISAILQTVSVESERTDMRGKTASSARCFDEKTPDQIVASNPPPISQTLPRLRTVAAQPVHVEFDYRDGYGDAPVLQDFRMKFTDQPDALPLAENGVRSSIQEGSVTQELGPFDTNSPT